MRTSSFRLALVCAAMTALAFLASFAVVFWSTARFMRHQIDDSVASEIEEILSDVAGGSAANVVAGLARHPSGFHYLLQDAAGRVLAGNMPALDARTGIREWGAATGGVDPAHAYLRGKGVRLGGDYLFVGWSTRQVLEMEAMVAQAFGWGLAGAVLLALLGGLVAGGRLTRRIETVSETSRDIVAGDLSRRIPERGSGDELDHLAASVNAMLDRIQSLMTDLHQVTTDIAHDMRTPLTRLRHRLESAERSDADPAGLRERIGGAVREIDTILGMFGALLRIAQIESGARRAGFSTVDLAELLGTAVELYRPAAEQRRQTLASRIAPSLAVRGDRDLLLQLFANLIENAIRHSPDGAHIELEAAATDTGVRVVVADDGPGIPRAMRDKVLQRFVRLERSRSTPGHGLGLSLAGAVAKLHEARMTLGDHAPGLEVSVELPRA